MKKLLVILFSILISFNSYGEWMKIASNMSDDVFYVDYDSIKSHNGYVYYWGLTDYIEPNSSGNMSSKIYYQFDCELDRMKYVSGIFYSESMGEGTASTETPPDDWLYPPPDSVYGYIIDFVCDYIN